MQAAVIYDCEYLTNRTSPQRFWNAPWDPDPTVVQIGAVRLGLDGDYVLGETFEALVAPRDRAGATAEIDPFFAAFTGITPARVQAEGVPLAEALGRFEAFAGGARCWSWGKDELNLIAVSCWLEGIPAPMPPGRFGNAAALLLAAGFSREVVGRARSNTLAALLGVTTPPLRAHDALDDARSVAYALQHLLRQGRLSAESLA